MTEVNPKGRNGTWVIFWRFAVGAGLIAVMKMSFDAGGLAERVEDNATNITRNEVGRREMGRDVSRLRTALARLEANIRAIQGEPRR